jgi:glycosyltransferase involved in cell wall biosynthesis
LQRCVESLLGEGIEPTKIIVVDGQSTDGSLDLAEKMGCTLLTDEGRGFAYARALGIQNSGTEFTLILGPDDIMDQGSINQMISEMMNEEKLAVLASRKQVLNPKNFWQKGMNSYYGLLPMGKLRAVGNPSLYRTKILMEHAIDTNFSANEDTDWCTRISRQGYLVMRSRVAMAFEIEDFSFSGFKRRWVWYGEGDLAFVQKWLSIDTRRALRHLVHPTLEYFVRVPFSCLVRFDVAGWLFSLLCWYFRTLGFVGALRKKSKFGFQKDLKGR